MKARMNVGRVLYRGTERCSVIFTHDPCEHAASLRNWSQDYLQLSAGAFSGVIIEASVGPIQILSESICQCVDQKAASDRDIFTVGVPLHLEGRGYWQGYQLERDSLMTLRPNEDLHFRTPRESRILVIAIDCSAFSAFAHDIASIDIHRLIAGSNVKRLPTEIAQRFRGIVNEVLTSIVSIPEVCEDPASAKAIIETVLNTSLYALRAQSAVNESPRNTHSVQRAIVERARDYILANRENPPTVSELSAFLKMSRRGLHHAFTNVLGINVITFLRYVRLHGAKKDLLRAGPRDSVNGIACKWGFWHMGMFSSYYKALFGELPSTTLRKTSSNRPLKNSGAPVAPC